MTDWRVAYSDTRPSEVDTTSSPSTVYLRKNIKTVTVEDSMGDGESRTMYEYLERTCTPEEYSVAQLSSELVALKHDTEVIDNYTAMLLEEGVL